MIKGKTPEEQPFKNFVDFYEWLAHTLVQPKCIFCGSMLDFDIVFRGFNINKTGICLIKCQNKQCELNKINLKIEAINYESKPSE